MGQPRKRRKGTQFQNTRHSVVRLQAFAVPTDPNDLQLRPCDLTILNSTAFQLRVLYELVSNLSPVLPMTVASGAIT